MNILIACEESQRVCIKFREKGHNAFSCDIIDCSGGHPEWHIKQDVLPLLNGQCGFYTADGKFCRIEGTWDMIIAHPPCTFLAVSGNRWFDVEKYGQEAMQRKKKREEAAEFFMTIAEAKCSKICIENPVGVMSTLWRKPNQIIQPYMFGDPVEKKTCLWLKGLSPLVPTNEVKPEQRIFLSLVGLWVSFSPKPGIYLKKKERACVQKHFQALQLQWLSNGANILRKENIMKRTKSQLNAVYYSYRVRLERRRNAREALYGWLNPRDISDFAAFLLNHAIEGGCAGEFVITIGGFREARRSINWYAVRAYPRYTHQYVAFERYRAAVRAQKSPYYRRRLAKLGIDWKSVKRPYGTEAIELD